MSKVQSQQQQINELRARIETLEAEYLGWKTVTQAAQALGVSATFIRDRLKLKPYRKTYQRVGRNYRVNIQLFQRQLCAESRFTNNGIGK